MMIKHGRMELVSRVSEAAASASEHLLPRPFRGVLDRTLVDVVCVANGGVVPVAAELRVDAPAVDAWRSLGVPQEFRARLTAMAMWPPHPTLPTLPSLPSLRVAA